MREAVSGRLVTVRAYQEEHIDPLYQAVCKSIPEVAQYETWCHPNYTRSEATEYVNWWRKMWTEEKAYYFAIEDQQTGVFLGSCGLSDLCKEHKRAGLGFWVHSGFTGRGFATDAARAVVRFGFDDLGLARIEVEVAVENKASQRVAEKLGGEHEGVLRQRLILPAGPADTAMYALIRT